MKDQTPHPAPDPALKGSTETRRAEEYLNNILSQAFRDKDDAVELQPLPMGLEVSWIAFGSGVGTIVSDRSLAAEILELVITRAGLATAAKGEFLWKSRGRRSRVIPVEKCVRLGATVFRLVLKPAQQ
ncbi:MAG: hypothetical protein KJ072_07975 [Verrucomicrobia bacterium]|nr:hypothetical protein [Verrucomicrobiota bacterium]